MRVAVSWALSRMKGRTFQPWPKLSAARAEAAGLGSVGLGMAMPPLPFSPVGFSAEMERVRPCPKSGRVPRPTCRPANKDWLRSLDGLPAAPADSVGTPLGPSAARLECCKTETCETVASRAVIRLVRRQNVVWCLMGFAYQVWC